MAAHPEDQIPFMSNRELAEAKQRLKQVEMQLSTEVDKRRQNDRRPARSAWLVGYVAAATVEAIRRRLS